MKNYIFLTLLPFLFQNATAQIAEADFIPAEQGLIKIQPILHGTVVIEWEGEVIYVDPYGGADIFESQETPGIILITDIHGDHLNPETLDALNTSQATFIVPQAVADQLDEKYKERLIILNNGDSTKVRNIPITALPMYNLPESPDSKHTKGRGNGYILELGGKNVYLSGDTEDIPEMRSLKNIDVAFVCMNLPYTMDIHQAASAVLAFKPTIVYPYHYRGKDGLSDVETFKKKVNSGNSKIEVRLRNWYPEH